MNGPFAQMKKKTQMMSKFHIFFPDLARLSLEKPVFVSVHEHSDKPTPDKLAQTYIVCELHDKINILWSFIKSHKKKKLLVFMQSCKQVKYVAELFKRLKVILD